jgi:ketosteroid isomerase-like protein
MFKRKTLVLISGGLLAVAATAAAMFCAGRSGGSRVDDEKTVAALDSQYQEAVKKNDVPTIERSLADDLVLVSGKGSVQSKADLLKESASGDFTYEHQEDGDRTVRVWGDTAVVTALLWAKGVENGKSFEYKIWCSDVYMRMPSGWRYMFAQVSRPLETMPGHMRY